MSHPTVPGVSSVIILLLNIEVQCRSTYNRRFHTNTSRLESYTKAKKKFPHRKPSPEELSDSGFFYLGDADQTQCYSCAKVLAEWEKDDSPFDEHFKFSPKCKFTLLERFKRMLLNQEEFFRVYSEAKLFFRTLYQFFQTSAFKIAVKLGHDEDFVAFIAAKKIIQNNYRMVSY